ncbi:MAG: F420-dependent NADP oxidoreductase [Bacteroidales bacterium]|nr:F420-dependent NADP oxidoreductase [Bacteroidales bacterium]
MDIVLIGSGNVASHLAKKLYAAKHSVIQVFSRSIENARSLAEVINAEAICNLEQINVKADLYILSVKDDVLSGVAEAMPDVKGIVVHTAGSISIDVLDRFSNYGVFYPFQTFTKETDVDFSNIPILVESNDDTIKCTLMNLGRELSNHVIQASSMQRGNLHIAAVYACNFANHMYRLAEDVLDKSNLSFELLHPLIMETASKVQKASPSATQTGPASRKDYKIIDKHLKSLDSGSELQEIYKVLTDSIIKRVK